MTMSISGVLAAMDQSPERHHQLAFADGDEFVSEYDGQEVRARNPLVLGSKLTALGMPAQANLYLIARADMPSLEAAREARS